jgi:hypothetical protein
VREGDVITDIGGNPAADYPLDRLREMFKREGQEYQLEIQRGDIASEDKAPQAHLRGSKTNQEKRAR